MSVAQYGRRWMNFSAQLAQLHTCSMWAMTRGPDVTLTTRARWNGSLQQPALSTGHQSVPCGCLQADVLAAVRAGSGLHAGITTLRGEPQLMTCNVTCCCCIHSATLAMSCMTLQCHLDVGSVLTALSTDHVRVHCCADHAGMQGHTHLLLLNRS